MKRRKKIMSLANKKIIFISLIISMSVIGVGYAEWNDSLTIDFSVKTGFTELNFDVGTFKEYDDGELYFTVSEDGDALIIKGKVYASFNEDLTINFVDNGSLPSIITDIQVDNNDVSTLKGSTGKQRTALFNINNKKMNSFTININPFIDSDSISIMKINATDFESKDEISTLEDELANLRNEISIYNKIEKRNFTYTITYEFGKDIWEKDLKIEGCIEVIPDPEVLSNMVSKLNDLQNQVNEKHEAQKILEEQQRLLEEQKLLEQGNIDQNPKEQNEAIDENLDNYINEDNNPISFPETDENLPDSDEVINVESEEIHNNVSETEEEVSNVSDDLDDDEIEKDDELEQTFETSDTTNGYEESNNDSEENSPEVNSEEENIETQQGDKTIELNN